MRASILTDNKVKRELRAIMHGVNHSWLCISQQLQARVNCGTLQIYHFESGNTIYEWNVFCDKKCHWKIFGRPLFLSFKFNRDCLVQLKIMPI